MKTIGILAAKWLTLVGIIGLGSSLTLAQVPVIVQQPLDQLTAVGYTTTFTVGITNPAPFPKVQWQNDQGPIPGATNSFNLTYTTYNDQFTNVVHVATYSITNTQFATPGNYQVTLSNTNGNTISSNATLRVIPPYTFITIAGVATAASGTNDGIGSSARFSSPRHVALDAQGNLFVTDFGNDTVRKVTPAGIVSTFAGTPDVAGTNDGGPGVALFNWPHGIALDKTGNIFVTDLNTNYNLYGGTIRKITPEGFVTTIAGMPGIMGTNDGVGSHALFSAPWGIAMDSAGNIFVSDRTTIRKLTTTDGTNWLVTTIAGLPGVIGSADGTNGAARFNYPDGMAIDSAGRIFIADEFNCLIREIWPTGTNWVVTTIGQFPRSLFIGPSALVADTNDNLYLAGQTAPVVYRMSANGTNWETTPIAGSNLQFVGQGTNDGTGIAARFESPHGIAMDNLGNLFVADAYGNIRKGWSSNVLPATTLNSPIASAGQVQLNFTVTTGSPTNFSLLQADTVNGPWSTNTVAQLITNIPGLFYQMTVPLTNDSAEFYRLKQL